jgi:ketosteroid isomerase-like protein
MRSLPALLLATGLAFAAAPAAHEGSAAGRAEILIGPGAEAAVAVVDEFSDALLAADLARVEALLDPEVLVLESGGAERSRAEYFREHAGADAAFLKDATVKLLRREARAHGELAWVGSETEIHASRDGKALVLLSTETMVLRRANGAWRIVHIHWSSRPKPAPAG